MLTVDNVTEFLLEQRLINASWIIDGPLVIRSETRRNRNLAVVGPGTAGFLIKQPYELEEAAYETLRREALFYTLCRQEPVSASMSEVIPRLLYHNHEKAILVFELLPGVTSFLSQLEDPRGRRPLIEAAYAFGQGLALVHQTLGVIDVGDPDKSWLPRDIPAVFQLHRPKAARRGVYSPAFQEILRNVRKSQGLGEALDGLQGLWRSESVIHADIKLDNVLVRSAYTLPEFDGVEVWIVDWELVQVGDPAWDIAGALQDLLVTWVRSMPVNESLGDEAMFARASLPLNSVRDIARALWSGYHEEAGLSPADTDHFLLRAVKYSAARLINSACEMSWYEDQMTPTAALMLRIAEDLLMEPESGRVILFGINPG